MLAVFQDARIELEEIREEVNHLEKKKLYRQALASDPEIADSHMRAMASFVHDIYTGIEKLLESLIRYFDGQLPPGEDWHRTLLTRAKFPNSDVRSAIISEGTHVMLDELRSFRHAFRNCISATSFPRG